MKTFEQLPEQCTYRQLFDNVNNVNNNLSDVDFLYKSYLGDGQLFNVVGNVGYVNLQEGRRNKNITITKDDIANFKISGYQFYHRKSNSIIDVDIDCNLYNYRDDKVHFLYLVLSNHGKYEVYDDMYHNSEDTVLFARFVIKSDGNAAQFYVIAPFAGSPDYIKGNTFYTVAEGLDLIYYSKSNKQFTIPETKIRFSGINFDNYDSPDVLKINPGDTNIKFKYIYYDVVSKLPRVNWTASDETNNLIIDKIINYNTGVISNVDSNKFTIQKIYYDFYTNKFVAMYGDKQYNSMTEAVIGIDSILSYPKPDGIDYILPIAVVIVKNSSEAYSDKTIRIIGLKYDEQELFDSNDLARQQAAEAIEKADNAISIANSAVSTISDHTSNKSNPHSVTKSQVGLGDVNNYGIASEAEARAAAVNTKYMTPLRTLNTIESKSIITDGNIVLKIANTQPARQSGKTVIWINTSS